MIEAFKIVLVLGVAIIAMWGLITLVDAFEEWRNGD